MLRKRYFVSIIGTLVLIMIMNWTWQKVRKTNLMLYRHRLEKKGFLGLNRFYVSFSHHKLFYSKLILLQKITLKKSVVMVLFTLTVLVSTLMNAKRSFRPN